MRTSMRTMHRTSLAPCPRSRRWIVVVEGLVEDIELVVVDGIDGHGVLLWPQGGGRAGGRWGPARPALAEPGGIPDLQVSQNALDDIVLLGVGER